MTFEREIMGLFGLGVVWVNTALIVVHAWNELSVLRSLSARLGPLRPEAFGLTRGIYRGTDGKTGPTYRLVQTARRGRDGKIYFHDRRRESTLQGGAVTTEAGTFALAPGSQVWVWPSKSRLAAQQGPRDVAEFEATFGRANHAAGVERTIEIVVAEGETLYVAGRLNSEGTELTGSQDEPLLLSMTEPLGWLRVTFWRNMAVLAAMVAIGAALTVLCFWQPAFGLVSKLGAFGLFIYFLLIQPLGLSLTRRSRMPHQAEVSGIWSRSALPEKEAPPARRRGLKPSMEASALDTKA